MTINKNITEINRTAANRKPDEIRYLVVHYVGEVSTAEDNTKYFKSIKRDASAHYFVDDASVWQCVEEKDIAWHCGTSGAYKHPLCRNANSIGVELCNVRDQAGKLSFTPATLGRGAALLRDLVKRYHVPPENILRHYDVTGKLCPAPMVELPEKWTEFKKRLTEEESDMTKEDVLAIIREYEAAKAAASPSEWSREAREWAEKSGLLVGDGAGSMRYKADATREELVTILNRFWKLPNR